MAIMYFWIRNLSGTSRAMTKKKANIAKFRPPPAPVNSDATAGKHVSSLACSPHPQLSSAKSPESIKGSDDIGNFYNSHADLTAVQAINKDEFYHANDAFWSTGGYNGSTDDEAMIGDSGGDLDGAEGLAFLDRYIAFLDAEEEGQNCNKQQRRRFDHAVDLGAGVGRVTKLVLLKRYREVRLVEGNEEWSKRSRTYLGRKRASRCHFVHQRLDQLTASDIRDWGEPADLMWVQWTLQYLIDADVVNCLRVLAGGLRAGSGIFIVKENRPYGLAREDRFQMDVPEGENRRYDITRSDEHHRLLFHQAGLKVKFAEKGVETNTYALGIL